MTPRSVDDGASRLVTSWCAIGSQIVDDYRKANVWRRLRNEDGTAVLAEENPDGEW